MQMPIQGTSTPVHFSLDFSFELKAADVKICP